MGFGANVKPNGKALCKIYDAGNQGGKNKNTLGVTEETAEAQAVFILYGCWGMIHNGKFTENSTEYEMEDILKVADKFFHEF